MDLHGEHAGGKADRSALVIQDDPVQRRLGEPTLRVPGVLAVLAFGEGLGAEGLGDEGSRVRNPVLPQAGAISAGALVLILHVVHGAVGVLELRTVLSQYGLHTE